MKVEVNPVSQVPSLNNEDIQVLINYWGVQKQNLLNNSEEVKKFNAINEKLAELNGKKSTDSPPSSPIRPKKVDINEYPLHGSIISKVKFILHQHPDLTANEIAAKIVEIEKLSKKEGKRMTQSCYAALNSGVNSKTKQFTRKSSERGLYTYRVIG